MYIYLYFLQQGEHTYTYNLHEQKTYYHTNKIIEKTRKVLVNDQYSYMIIREL